MKLTSSPRGDEPLALYTPRPVSRLPANPLSYETISLQQEIKSQIRQNSPQLQQAPDFQSLHLSPPLFSLKRTQVCKLHNGQEYMINISYTPSTLRSRTPGGLWTLHEGQKVPSVLRKSSTSFSHSPVIGHFTLSGLPTKMAGVPSCSETSWTIPSLTSTISSILLLLFPEFGISLRGGYFTPTSLPSFIVPSAYHLCGSGK